MLSQGGRLILIKHVLATIPIHVLTSMQPTWGVLQDIEKLFAAFFWGSDEDGRQKRVWRSWASLAYPIQENGLGVRRLYDVAKALSCKLWWKYKSGLGLWAEYMQTRDIEKSVVAGRLEEVHELMMANSEMLIRSGSSNFIRDNWTGRGAFGEIFDFTDSPLLPYTIRDLYTADGWAWELLWPELPPEVLQWVADSTPEYTAGQDVLVWKPTASGAFSVSSAFDVVRQTKPSNNLSKSLWNPRIPTRVSVFQWRLVNRLLPFPDILASFKLQLPGKCPHCPALDSIEHCFVSCRLAVALWNKIAATFDLYLHLESGVAELLGSISMHKEQGLAWIDHMDMDKFCMD